MPRKKLSPRERFVHGTVDRWKVSGYGCTVEVWSENRRLKIRWTKPKRHQETWSEDTPANREQLAAVAEAVAERLRVGDPPPHPRQSQGQGVVTVGEVWRRYLRERWPGIPDALVNGRPSRAEVRAYYEGMTTAVRDAVPGPDYLLSCHQRLYH